MLWQQLEYIHICHFKFKNHSYVRKMPSANVMLKMSLFTGMYVLNKCRHEHVYIDNVHIILHVLHKNREL